MKKARIVVSYTSVILLEVLKQVPIIVHYQLYLPLRKDKRKDAGDCSDKMLLC